jgi:hypothetical protein
VGRIILSETPFMCNIIVIMLLIFSLQVIVLESSHYHPSEVFLLIIISLSNCAAQT